MLLRPHGHQASGGVPPIGQTEILPTRTKFAFTSRVHHFLSRNGRGRELPWTSHHWLPVLPQWKHSVQRPHQAKLSQAMAVGYVAANRAQSLFLSELRSIPRLTAGGVVPTTSQTGYRPLRRLATGAGKYKEWQEDGRGGKGRMDKERKEKVGKERQER